MAFKFTPKSEEELRMANLIEPGVYQFRVNHAEEKVSKAGNPMIELKMVIWVGSSEHIIYDYLLPNAESKLRHFCYGTNMDSKYQSGTLSANDCLGKQGNLRLTIQKDKSGKYGPRNSVADYICSDNEKSMMNEVDALYAPSKSVHPNHPDFDEGDPIPF